MTSNVEKNRARGTNDVRLVSTALCLTTVRKPVWPPLTFVAQTEAAAAAMLAAETAPTERAEDALEAALVVPEEGRDGDNARAQINDHRVVRIVKSLFWVALWPAVDSVAEPEELASAEGLQRIGRILREFWKTDIIECWLELVQRFLGFSAASLVQDSDYYGTMVHVLFDEGCSELARKFAYWCNARQAPSSFLLADEPELKVIRDLLELNKDAATPKYIVDLYYQ